MQEPRRLQLLLAQGPSFVVYLAMGESYDVERK